MEIVVNIMFIYPQGEDVRVKIKQDSKIDFSNTMKFPENTLIFFRNSQKKSI